MSVNLQEIVVINSSHNFHVPLVDIDQMQTGAETVRRFFAALLVLLWIQVLMLK
jgi:hypothetical protein